MNLAVAELSAVSKRYGKVTALDRIDLTLHSGQVTALLGQNGAGKTTAVRLMLGLAQPTTGTARLFDQDPRSLEARQRVGVQLQVSKVPETLKVVEHIRLFCSYYPAPLAIDTVVELAGLAGLEDRAFGRLSGGQQQRLLFALAICGNPELLVLDEPTVGLDVEARRSFWSEMRRQVSLGRSLLLTTHYIEEADALADRIVILQSGRIIADGTPADVKARGTRRHVRCATRLTVEQMSDIPGVHAVQRDHETARLSVDSVEPVVRELLARDPFLSELEIPRANLEEAFVELIESGARDMLQAEAR